MADLTGWAIPTKLTCNGCGAIGICALGAGYFGEPTETMPAGWMRSYHKQRGPLYACSEACALKIVAEVKADG